MAKALVEQLSFRQRRGYALLAMIGWEVEELTDGGDAILCMDASEVKGAPFPVYCTLYKDGGISPAAAMAGDSLRKI